MDNKIIVYHATKRSLAHAHTHTCVKMHEEPNKDVSYQPSCPQYGGYEGFPLLLYSGEFQTRSTQLLRADLRKQALTTPPNTVQAANIPAGQVDQGHQIWWHTPSSWMDKALMLAWTAHCCGQQRSHMYVYFGDM